MRRAVVCLALLAIGGAACDALLGIPSAESYEATGVDAGTHEDATVPDTAAPDVPVFTGDDAEDANDAGPDSEPEAGPDCATVFDPDWASWRMPNSTQETEAGIIPNPEAYLDNGDGTVTDEVTHLIWQQAPSTMTFSWKDAKNYCANLTIGGQGGWHLASFVELISIVDYGPTSPAVNAKAFPRTPADVFWSSTPQVNAANTDIWPFFVHFANGATSADEQSSLHYARCVRSIFASACRYVVPGDGTVFDTQTKLTWQKDNIAAPFQVDWPTAAAYCASVRLGQGSGTWRLPTIKELATIVDFDIDPGTGFATDPSLFPTIGGVLWSSTLTSDSPPQVWTLKYDGTNFPSPTDDTFNAGIRCVR